MRYVKCARRIVAPASGIFTETFDLFAIASLCYSGDTPDPSRLSHNSKEDLVVRPLPATDRERRVRVARMLPQILVPGPHCPPARRLKMMDNRPIRHPEDLWQLPPFCDFSFR